MCATPKQYFVAGASWSSNKTPPSSSLSEQAGMANNAKALSSTLPPSSSLREQARNCPWCQGTVIWAAAAATIIVWASKGQPMIPRCHCPRRCRHHHCPLLHEQERDGWQCWGTVVHPTAAVAAVAQASMGGAAKDAKAQSSVSKLSCSYL